MPQNFLGWLQQWKPEDHRMVYSKVLRQKNYQSKNILSRERVTQNEKHVNTL